MKNLSDLFSNSNSSIDEVKTVNRKKSDDSKSKTAYSQLTVAEKDFVDAISEVFDEFENPDSIEVVALNYKSEDDYVNYNRWLVNISTVNSFGDRDIITYQLEEGGYICNFNICNHAWDILHNYKYNISLINQAIKEKVSY